MNNLKGRRKPVSLQRKLAVNVNTVRQDQFEMQLIQHGAHSHFVIRNFVFV